MMSPFALRKGGMQASCTLLVVISGDNYIHEGALHSCLHRRREQVNA